MNKYEKRIAIVDILKAVSMILILIGHTGWEERQRNILGFPFWVDMAVPVFMILSGFIFAMQFDKRGIKFVDESYSREYVIKNLLRFILPFLPIYFLEVFACIYAGFFKGTGITLMANILLDFIGGGQRSWQLLRAGNATVCFIISIYMENISEMQAS